MELESVNKKSGARQKASAVLVKLVYPAFWPCDHCFNDNAKTKLYCKLYKNITDNNKNCIVNCIKAYLDYSKNSIANGNPLVHDKK